MALDPRDRATVELIAVNAIGRMLADHTLQAGLRGCEADCGWLGHESRVVTCGQLSVALRDVIGSAVTDFSFDAETNVLRLVTTVGAWMVDLTPLTVSGGAQLDTTDDLPEGALNLYFTAARAAAAAPVQSVNGLTGAIVLDATSIGAEPAGTAVFLLAAHTTATDPHPQYLTHNSVLDGGNF